MPVIFAPRRAGAPVNMMTGIGAALETAFKTHQQMKDRERALNIEEERRKAEAEERRSRSEFRQYQMDRYKNEDARQERADILADLDIQAGEAVEQTIPQQQEISNILKNLPPITMDAGGAVDLEGNVVPGTEQKIELGSPKINAPSVESLLANRDEKVVLPEVGGLKSREVSVGDRAQAILRERRAAQAEEMRKGGLKTFFDPNSNQYVSVYEGEARERGYLPEAAGREYFKRQEEYREAERKRREGGGTGDKAPKGMWKGDKYMEYINGQWTVNDEVSKIAAAENEDRGDPGTANEIQTRYRDELGLQPGTDDYRKQFEQEFPADYEAVMSMVRGEIPPERLGSMRSGRREYLVSMAQQLTGRKFNAAQVTAMAKTRQNFATGAEAKNKVSINTAIQHLGEVDKAMRDIYKSFNMSSAARQFLSAGGQFPSLNSMMNWIAKEAGSDKVTKLEGALNAAATEMAKALKGNASPTEQEIAEQREIINSFSSPDQITGYIEQNAALLAGRLHSLEDQWRTVFGEDPEPGSILSPSSMRIAQEHGFAEYITDPNKAAYNPTYEADRTLYQREEYGGDINDLFKSESADLPAGFELDR